MLRLAIRFPAGAYHATPWGRHVNEGDIEWPPSPLRLCRALLAAGFSKLGWTAVPAEARALIERLAAAPPVYHLPPAAAGHTRHYMPIAKGATAQVLDAFAYVGRSEGAVLGVTWDVDLGAAERAMAALLVERLGYLGRAESWVAAELVEALPEGLSECRCSEAAPGPRHERIALLAPLDAEAYARFRRDRVEAAIAGRAASPARPGAKPPSKAAERKAAEKIEALYPADLIACLLKDTAALQRDGWSQPPGTRWLSYWREVDVLSPTPRGVAKAPRAARRADTALLALASETTSREVLPRFEDALLRMEALHDALVKRSAGEDGSGPSPCLSGKDAEGRPRRGHGHAWLLPLRLDGSAGSGAGGRMDHVLVYAPMGFDARAREALASVRKAYAKDRPLMYVTLVGLGERADLAPVVPSLGAHEVWRSALPFVPPRHLKRRGSGSLEGQVQAELASRGLPAAVSVEVELEGGVWLPAADFWAVWERRAPGRVRMDAGEGEAPGGEEQGGEPRLASRWLRYRRERLSAGSPKPPIATGLGLRLRFAEPVRGPIALGYASHFGLGAMEPVG
ncbi:MAG: type I-U CRISPR-associated protein Cas5/Cas6 [Polyangiaceae bacterium]|nr:type I-U CRISPR-associated protein Cas5/Cas6 [Polyangiaceae bacterium]